jgi:hypothetical protein
LRCCSLHTYKSTGENEETTRITPPQNLEDLQAKVDRMADNIIHFSKREKDADRDIRQRLLQIIEGAKRLNVDKNELQRMFRERLQGGGPQAAALESHVRRVVSSNWNRVCSSN